MSSKTGVTCDNCTADLSDSGPRVDYMLTLEATRLHSTSAVSFGSCVVRPLEEAHHFCGFHCLKQWIARNAK